MSAERKRKLRKLETKQKNNYKFGREKRTKKINEEQKRFLRKLERRRFQKKEKNTTTEEKKEHKTQKKILEVEDAGCKKSKESFVKRKERFYKNR